MQDLTFDMCSDPRSETPSSLASTNSRQCISHYRAGLKSGNCMHIWERVFPSWLSFSEWPWPCTFVWIKLQPDLHFTNLQFLILTPCSLQLDDVFYQTKSCQSNLPLVMSNMHLLNLCISIFYINLSCFTQTDVWTACIEEHLYIHCGCICTCSAWYITIQLI